MQLVASRPVYVCALALLLGACVASPEEEVLTSEVRQALVDPAQVLGFESTAHWNASTGTKTSTTDRTQGNAALALKNFTFAELQTVPLANVPGATATISFDLKAPISPPWGQTMLFVSIPSRGVYNAYAGQVWFAGMPANTYQKMTFTLPSSVVTALGQSYADLTFKITLSVPQTSADYKLDNLRFEGSGETLAQACTPPINYLPTDPQGDQIFRQAIAPATPATFMVGITRQVCQVLYKTAAEVTRRPNPLTLEIFDFDGIAFASDTTGDGVNDYIAFSSRYIEGPPPIGLAEFQGVLAHEAAHIYQHGGGGVPGGVIEGVADWVRFNTGYDSLSRRFPGGNWDDGYTTTGFFLDWLDDQYPDFTYRFNQRIGEPWSTQFFVDLTGSDVNTLWAQYQDAITP
jgi:Peptidase of plants and bacteria